MLDRSNPLDELDRLNIWDLKLKTPFADTEKYIREARKAFFQALPFSDAKIADENSDRVRYLMRMSSSFNI